VITALVTFLFVALAVFFIVKGYNKMQRHEPGEPEPEAEPEDVILLREILEELKAQRAG
jgi:large conductance mechanosensitive channel